MLLLHIVYMSLHTWRVSESLTTALNATATSMSDEYKLEYGLFLIYPILLFIYEVYVLIFEGVTTCRRMMGTTAQSDKSLRRRIVDKFSNLSDYFITHFSRLGTLIFFSFSVAWYVLFYLDDKNQIYMAMMVLLFGWLYTITFTKGLKSVHS